MSKKYASFKGQKLLTENFRDFIKEGEWEEEEDFPAHGGEAIVPPGPRRKGEWSYSDEEAMKFDRERDERKDSESEDDPGVEVLIDFVEDAPEGDESIRDDAPNLPDERNTERWGEGEEQLNEVEPVMTGLAIVGAAFIGGMLLPVAWFFTKGALNATGRFLNAWGRVASHNQWKVTRALMQEKEQELSEQRKAEMILLLEFLSEDERFDSAMDKMTVLLKRGPRLRNEAKKKAHRKEMRAASKEFNTIVHEIIEANKGILSSKKAATFVTNIRDMLKSGELQATDRAADFAAERRPERSEEDSFLPRGEPEEEDIEMKMKQRLRQGSIMDRALSESGCGPEPRKIRVHIRRKS